MGIAKGPGDANAYFDFMHQAADGSFFFRNSYTSEPMNPFLIRPLYWVMGVSSKVLPPVVVWHLFRVLLTILFLFLSYLFISRFTTDIPQRMLALLILGAGSGLGYLILLINQIWGTNFRGVDLWLTEAIPFLSFNAHPHFILSFILILGSLGFFYKGISENKRKLTLYAGLFCFLLGFVHIYDVITIYAVISVYILLLWIRERKINFDYFMHGLVFLLVSFSSTLYYILVFTLDPVFQNWTDQNQLISPPVSGYLFGFGFILLFATLFILYLIKNKTFFKKPGTTFLSVWLIVNFLILYFPISIQRRFVEGMFIPMAILASFGFMMLLRKYCPKKFHSYAISIFLLILIPSNVYVFLSYFNPTYDPGSPYHAPHYLSDDQVSVLNWLGKQASPEEVILADAKFSNYIPRVAGSKVYIGHWAQTVNYNEKLEWYTRLNAQRLDIEDLKEKGIDYLVVEEFTDELPLFYKSGNLHVYKVG